jgi:hypothetical protein
MSRWAVLLLALLALAGCKSAPGANGEYSTPARGGCDNFRGGA